MAQQVKPEPQSAADYDERTTAAVKSVLDSMQAAIASAFFLVRALKVTL